MNCQTYTRGDAMKDELSLRGEYLIEVREAKTGRLIKQVPIKNTLTLINQQIRTAMLLGTASSYTMNDLVIKYFAFGTDSTSATSSDTRLGAETLRKQVTNITQTSPSTVRSIVSLGTQEGNFHIKEIGVFVGPNATSEANTGTLLSRVVVDIDKNSNLVVNVIRSDICTI